MLPVINTQPAEKPDHREDGSLEIVHFWFTIQGEGLFAGYPATFVRLAGCSLLCPACDSDYTTRRKRFNVDDLVSTVKALNGDRKHGLVVITGGEPFRQNISPFVKELLAEGFMVQIETNGTLFIADLPYGDDEFTVICSPKTPTINSLLVPHVNAFKYILDARWVNYKTGLPLRSLDMPFPPAPPPVDFPHTAIFIQPMDTGSAELNEANTQAAVKSCMEHGYRISIQIHKLLGLD